MLTRWSWHTLSQLEALGVPVSSIVLLEDEDDPGQFDWVDYRLDWAPTQAVAL
jgi:hypothetical protein